MKTSPRRAGRPPKAVAGVGSQSGLCSASQSDPLTKQSSLPGQLRLGEQEADFCFILDKVSCS